MAKYICQIKSRWFEWSTIVDGPTTWGMSFDEFLDYFRDQYGRESMQNLPSRIMRAVQKGTSSRGHIVLDELINDNRAGPNESTLSKTDLLYYLENRRYDEQTPEEAKDGND